MLNPLLTTRQHFILPDNAETSLQRPLLQRPRRLRLDPGVARVFPVTVPRRLGPHQNGQGRGATAARFDPLLRQVVSELGMVRKLDASHARAVLGWTPRPAAESIVDAGRSMIELGVVKV